MEKGVSLTHLSRRGKKTTPEGQEKRDSLGGEKEENEKYTLREGGACLAQLYHGVEGRGGGKKLHGEMVEGKTISSLARFLLVARGKRWSLRLKSCLKWRGNVIEEEKRKKPYLAQMGHKGTLFYTGKRKKKKWSEKERKVDRPQRGRESLVSRGEPVKRFLSFR